MTRTRLRDRKFIAHPGDMYACNYTLFPRVRHENRGSEPNASAGLAMGGPWVPGMVDTPGLYREAGGVGLALPFPQLSAVEKEILDAGAMTLSIRKVVMEPGSRNRGDGSLPDVAHGGRRPVEVGLPSGGFRSGRRSRKPRSRPAGSIGSWVWTQLTATLFSQTPARSRSNSWNGLWRRRLASDRKKSRRASLRELTRFGPK